MSSMTDNRPWRRPWLRGFAYAVSLVPLCAYSVMAADGSSAVAHPPLPTTGTPITFLATLPNDTPPSDTDLAPVMRHPRRNASDAALPPVVVGHRSSPPARTAKIGRAADRKFPVRWTSPSVEPNGDKNNGDPFIGDAFIGDGRGRPSYSKGGRPSYGRERRPYSKEGRPSYGNDRTWLDDAIDPNCPCLRGGEAECCHSGSCAGLGSWRPEGITGPWPPDEYICDGGDRETRVVVNQDWEVSGLDLEDTIAHYDTQDGRTIVTPSNNVCIYAPRFAAVRKIVQTSVDERLLVMSELDQPLPPLTDAARRRVNVVDQPLPPLHDVSLKGPIALLDRTRGVDLLKVLPVLELVRDFAVHEDLQIIRLGIHRRSEQPLLAEASQAALVWTDNLAPEVILDEQVAEVDVRVQKAESVYHIGQGPPRLRVIKVASCCSALPGEEITFTLRFDNIGEQTIGNVTLLDNLTTRLEYIPDTAECSLKADFYTDENEGESLALRWEIREPVKPGEGGIIRFRCRVR